MDDQRQNEHGGAQSTLRARTRHSRKRSKPQIALHNLNSSMSSSPAPKPNSLWGFVVAYRRRISLLVVLVVLGLLVGSWHASPNSPLSGTSSTAAQSLQDWLPGSRDVLLNARRAKEVIIHPIPRLMADAQAKFKKMILGQSKTLEQAVKEYKRRYGREPPKGFDEWFAFAQKNNVKIIDEYDQLMRDLEPFWKISGEEVRRRAIQIGHLPSIDLVRLEGGKAITMNIQNGFNDSEVSARAKGFRVMIEKFQHKLPNMDFPINAKAEGRILVPWEHSNYPNLTRQDSSPGIQAMLGGEFIPDWRGDSNVWEAYRRTCEPTSQARRLFASLRAQTDGRVPRDHFEAAGYSSGPDDDFKFSARVDDDFDFCNHPWARYQQGHFFSDWRTIHVLYPVFSPAKGEGFGDILIPSHYYYSSTKRYTYGWDPVTMTIKEVDDHEQPWSKKTNKIFWRGATTGGGSSPPGFLASYQRHRFLRMSSDTTDSNRTLVFADPPGTDSFTYAKVPIKDINEEIFDAAFTKAVGCTQYHPGGCDGLRKDHRFAEAVPLGEHWRHKYLIDLDGMGYSARLFAFLASDSAVIKSTIYREFFSDWIQPWLHYIPLSSSYKELYNIHAYFTPPSGNIREALNNTNPNVIQRKNPKALDGDAQLRRIARAGRQWKLTIGRKVDMETYVYRLCLEWARLWADDREHMAYKH